MARAVVRWGTCDLCRRPLRWDPIGYRWVHAAAVTSDRAHTPYPLPEDGPLCTRCHLAPVVFYGEQCMVCLLAAHPAGKGCAP